MSNNRTRSANRSANNSSEYDEGYKKGFEDGIQSTKQGINNNGLKPGNYYTENESGKKIILTNGERTEFGFFKQKKNKYNSKSSKKFKFVTTFNRSHSSKAQPIKKYNLY